jgi:hypothetical protein
MSDRDTAIPKLCKSSHLDIFLSQTLIVYNSIFKGTEGTFNRICNISKTLKLFIKCSSKCQRDKEALIFVLV